jgi:hypothetical protein
VDLPVEQRQERRANAAFQRLSVGLCICKITGYALRISFQSDRSVWWLNRQVSAAELAVLHRSSYYRTFLPPRSLECVHRTLGHSIHIQHRDPRTLSIKGPTHNRRCTVVCAGQSHPSGPPTDFRQRRNPPLKQPILHSSHHTSK